MLYRLLFRTVLVRTDPERAHELALGLIRGVAATPGLSHAVRATLGRRPRRVVRTPLGRPVPGVLGLAAGMDKNAATVLGMDMLGFGHVEVGTVTAHPQPGNDRPRLWRHPQEHALVNRMGFNNEGAHAAAERLRRLRSTRRGRGVVVGALSLLTPELFPRDTVWSRFGSGYGFVPLVLPALGLFWLWRSSPGRVARASESR